jgi:WD40 repeat protein
VRVAQVISADARALRRGLAADPESFALSARQAALARMAGMAQEADSGEASQQRVLLVVDQFEQLFTQCDEKEEQQAFVTALHAAATAGHGDQQLPAAVVVLVVRADFEARSADYPLLAAAVQERYLLTSMTERQLRMAITQPAAVVGSSVDSDLVQVLLDEVRAHASSPTGGPGGVAIGAGLLPLLSHALDQAWRGRTGQVLTLADYERTSGIQGAVAESAQRAYERLSYAQQIAARQVFTRLTDTNSDGLDTIARVVRADLAAGKDEAQTRDVEAVLETFVAERLLTLAGSTVEISHEAVLTAWPLLRDTWLADTHADRIIRTRLHTTAEEWIRASRDPAYLYSGSRLETAADAAARMDADERQLPLTWAERDFLNAGRQAGRRRMRRRQAFTAALLLLIISLAGVAVTAIRASHASIHERDIAISDQLASESEAVGIADATRSQLESIAAWSVYPTAQARYSMLAAAASPESATLTAGDGSVASVAFSPDGKTLATADDGGTTRLWNLATGQQIRSLAVGGSGTANSVAFSPDGKTLATGNADDTTGLWNLTTGQQIRNLPVTHPFNGILSVAFSASSKILATGGTDGMTLLWNLVTGKQIRRLLGGSSIVNGVYQTGIDSVAFSPDGKILATGTADGMARLWNLATGKQIRGLVTGSFVYSVAFSPDGKTLATGAADGTARLWNLATGQQIGIPLPGGSGSVYSVAFSPDGKTLATGDVDGTARLWNLATKEPIYGVPAGGTSNGVSSLAVSPDGKTLATGDADGTARLWKLATGQPIRSLNAGPAFPKAVVSMAVSPDGKTLATGSYGMTRLWNLATGQPIRSFAAGSYDAVYSMAFSSDGKLLAMGEFDGRVQLWNLASGREIGSPLPIGAGPVNSIAFSRDSKTLAAADYGGPAQLWNVATGRRSRGLFTGSANSIYSVAFSPDGKTLATGDRDGTARLWDVATGREIGSPLPSGAGLVNSVAFSPDGKTLATGDRDGTARLWDVTTGLQIGNSLPGGSGGISSVQFTPDGKSLVTGDYDGPARLWNVSYLIDPLGRLCSQVGGSLTPAEWARYVPSGPVYRPVCR